LLLVGEQLWQQLAAAGGASEPHIPPSGAGMTTEDTQAPRARSQIVPGGQLPHPVPGPHPPPWGTQTAASLPSKVVAAWQSSVGPHSVPVGQVTPHRSSAAYCTHEPEAPQSREMTQGWQVATPASGRAPPVSGGPVSTSATLMQAELEARTRARASCRQGIAITHPGALARSFRLRRKVDDGTLAASA
jgi:hypothetical protein